MRRLAIVVLSFVCVNCFGQQYSKSWIDLDYAGDEKTFHKLGVYLPKVEKPTYPAVIVIYGSAWFGNNLKGTVLSTLGKALLDSGFAVVAPNHRSSSDAKFPAQINDIKAVIRFMRANAEKYQVDTSFVGITGSSSGGHLAALAGTSGLVKQYKVGSATADLEGAVGQDTTYSSSVDAVVDWFGPTNFLVMDSCGSTMVHDAANSPESSLIGGAIQDNKEKCALANPITYVDANDPPFLILHGDADPLVPHCQSELLFGALQKVNVPSQSVLVANAQHGPGLFEEEYYKMMTAFFKMQSVMTRVDSGEKDGTAKLSFIQNHPNPFNATTTISFDLPVASHVTITVYDILGRQVDTLGDEEKKAGLNSVTWNAEAFQRGVYFAKLVAGRVEKYTKLVLQK